MGTSFFLEAKAESCARELPESEFSQEACVLSMNFGIRREERGEGERKDAASEDQAVCRMEPLGHFERRRKP